MILYATKQTIKDLNIPMVEELSKFNRIMAQKVIREQTDDRLLEWGLKLFYFDGRKCVQAVNYASKLTVFLFDIKEEEIAFIANGIAIYLMNIYEKDKNMTKILEKFFEDYPACTFSKITDRSIIASLDHNQFEFADDGDAFYDYIENGILKSKEINRKFNWQCLTSQTIKGKKEYIYPAERFRELLMNTCFKMIGKLSPETDEKLKKILHTESKSFYPEVQERANEYITFTQIAKNDMQLKITSNVPVPEFDKEENEGSNNNVGEEPGIDHKDTIVEEYETDKGYRSLINGASVTGDTSGMQKPKKSKKVKANQEGDGMQNIQNVQPQAQQQSQPQGMDLFGDIFGSTGNTGNTQPQNQGSNDIFNLLGNMGGNANGNSGAQQQGGLMDLNSILSGNNQQQQQEPQPQQNTLQQNLKEVFKNNDLTIYSSLIQNNNVYTGSFFVSNNTNSQINDVVVNLLVKKYISCQIHSTTGKDLAPNASLAIRKDVTMTNNDPSKGCVLKMTINYVKDGNNINDSVVVKL